MFPNHSPWIEQLKRTRPVVPINQSQTTEVAIVGGGIAGVVTAYFTLRDTNKKVVLLEADKVAHGATGHNAGQIASYFERSFFSLVEEFGLDLAAAGQTAVESGWSLLDRIYRETNLKTPYYQFAGYAGCTTLEQLVSHLKNNVYREQSGLTTETILVTKESGIASEIPVQYNDYYGLVSHQELLALLETNNLEYIAALSYPKGCLNSALFTEELIGYCVATYPDRFSFYEGSPVTQVILKKNHGLLKVSRYTVDADRIVLCTNGFENFQISNNTGAEINTKFHHLVMGRIGYMAGYIEPAARSLAAISYFSQPNENNIDPAGEPYFFLTRRAYAHTTRKPHNLVCVGGPEKVLPNQAIYSRTSPNSEEYRMTINEFLQTNYRFALPDMLEHQFSWHGLMGYTPNRIRRVGPEPCNPVLLYNLGCNGVGILPSIFGGYKISKFLNGIKMKKSIFDPEDQRC